MTRILVVTFYLIMALMAPMQGIACDKLDGSLSQPVQVESHEMPSSDCHSTSEETAETECWNCFSCIAPVACVSTLDVRPHILIVDESYDISTHLLPSHNYRILRPPIA